MLVVSSYINTLNKGMLNNNLNINLNLIINKAFKEPELYKEAINSIYKDNQIKVIKVKLNILNLNNT